MVDDSSMLLSMNTHLTMPINFFLVFHVVLQCIAFVTIYHKITFNSEQVLQAARLNTLEDVCTGCQRSTWHSTI